MNTRRDHIDTLLGKLEEQRLKLEKHLSPPMDEDSVSLKQESLEQYFDELRQGMLEEYTLSIIGDHKACLYVGDYEEIEYYTRDEVIWSYLVDVVKETRSLTIEDLVSLFGIDNHHLCEAITMKSTPLMRKHGLSSGLECVALMGLAENQKAEEFMTYVNEGTYDPVSKMVASHTMIILHAPESLQNHNLNIGLEVAIKASDYLQRIYDWLVSEMGWIPDYFQMFNRRMIADKNRLSPEMVRKDIEEDIAKETLSKRAVKGGKAKNQLVGFYRKKAIEIYEPGVYPTYTEAANKIIAELHQLAESRNERLPLTPTNAPKTVLNWLRAHRSPKAKG